MSDDTEYATRTTHNTGYSFQSDIDCYPENHDIERFRFNTGKHLSGKIVSVSCRRCGRVLSSHITKEPLATHD